MFLKTGLISCIDELENDNQIISSTGRAFIVKMKPYLEI
jgi:hypothetical protein